MIKINYTFTTPSALTPIKILPAKFLCLNYYLFIFEQAIIANYSKDYSLFKSTCVNSTSLLVEN